MVRRVYLRPFDQDKGLKGKVQVWNREQAGLIIPDENEVIISIREQDDVDAPLHNSWRAVLRLVFDDVTEQDVRDFGHLGLVPFTEDHANQILDFIAAHEDMETVHVHCAAGISRSVAVGMIVAQQQGRELWLNATHSTDLANGLVLRTFNRMIWYPDAKKG